MPPACSKHPYVPPKQLEIPPVSCQLEVSEGQLAIENPSKHHLAWCIEPFDNLNRSGRDMRKANLNANGGV